MVNIKRWSKASWAGDPAISGPLMMLSAHIWWYQVTAMLQLAV